MIKGHAAPEKVWGGTQAEVLALIQHEQQNRTKTGLYSTNSKIGPRLDLVTTATKPVIGLVSAP